MDTYTLLQHNARQFGSKPAIIFNDQTVTFAQLQPEVFRLAGVLRELGVAKGDKVAIYLPSGPQYVYSYLACFCLGAVGVPLDYMLKEDELISCLTHCDAKVFICKPQHQEVITAVAQALPAMKLGFFGWSGEKGESSGYDLEQLMRAADNAVIPPVINDHDPALIMYTSGTTGKPKGILLNYQHLAGSPAAMKHFVDLTERDIKLVAIPFSHIGGFIYIQNCLVFGITLVLMERFSPLEFLGNIQKYKVTCFHIVPPMYTAMLMVKQIEKFDLSSLRWVVVFGAPSSPEILERFHQYCPNAQLLNGWGMTETCPPNTVTPLGSTNIASVGKPAPHCEIQVMDEQGQSLAAGLVGEIVIRGWVIMPEYYKDPQATADVKRDGWLYTGDLGRFDTEGFLYIVGRKKEVIKVGGQLVYAPEVEAALCKNPAVAEAAVIGVADELRGETVKAFVVLRAGVDLSAQDLRYFAREHLAHFKVPQAIEIRESLPKNRTGKIDKELLKEAVAK